MRIEHLDDAEIQSLLDDTFSASVQNRRHLMVCQKCQEELLDYRLLASQLDTAEAGDTLSDNFTQSVLRRIAEIDERASVKRKWFVLSALGSIAAVVVATGIALVADVQPLVPGVRDMLIVDLSGRIGPTLAAVRSAFTPSQSLGYACAAAAALSAVSMVEAALLRPLKTRLTR